MTKEHESFIKNMKAVARRLLNAETERELKTFVGEVWLWLTLRTFADRNELIDKILPGLLKAIEEAYEWNIPSMKEIENQINPPDDE